MLAIKGVSPPSGLKGSGYLPRCRIALLEGGPQARLRDRVFVTVIQSSPPPQLLKLRRKPRVVRFCWATRCLGATSMHLAYGAQCSEPSSKCHGNSVVSARGLPKEEPRGLSLPVSAGGNGAHACERVHQTRTSYARASLGSVRALTKLRRRHLLEGLEHWAPSPRYERVALGTPYST